VLASPIIWPFPPAFWGAATKDRAAKYWKAYARHQKRTENAVRRLVTERLSLLMDHYGISDKENMAALALALASEHVPGFKIVTPKKSNKGRKSGIVLGSKIFLRPSNPSKASTAIATDRR
jgi:hypothetical protein